MSDIGEVGGADSAPQVDAPEPAGTVSTTEKSEIAAETRAVTPEATTAVANAVVGNDDTFTAQAQQPQTPAAAPKQEPGVFEQVGNWIGETAKGYATGAINTVLDTATMINKPINAGLNAVGVPYQFPTGIRLQPTTPAEANAQNAVEIASMVGGLAGLAKSGPALARLTDDAVNATKSLFGAGTATTRVLGDLRPFEINAIQNAANIAKEDIWVTGSAAKGLRRNLDSDLPLGTFGQSKVGTRSDIDYAVRTSADDYVNGLNLGLPDVDPGFGIRGLDYINLNSSPAIRFSPFKPPEFFPQGGGQIFLK